MKTADFFQHFHDVSNKDGYSFFFDEKLLEAVQQKSPNKQFLVQCLMSLSRMSVGLPTLFQPSGLYEYEKHNKETLIEDLKRLQNYCDLVAIKDSNGDCHLRTVISADDIADESLVGSLAIIHEQAHN